MRIEFLGTAAADACPDPFCECEYCEAFRKVGGKSIRMRSSMLLNDDLIIDLGPDLLVAANRRGTSFAKIRYALQTHPHNDHADPTTMYMRSDDCLPDGLVTMTYALSNAAIDVWDHVMEDHHRSFREADVQARHHIEIMEIVPWLAFTLGHYEVQSIKASHAQPELEAMLFAIRDLNDGSTFFYGTDTGPLPADTWPRLAALGWRFDVMTMDHTRGFRSDLPGHLGENGFMAEVAAAREAGVIDENTRVIATHFAHHSTFPHEQLAERCAANGYEPAYDGMVVSIPR